MGNNLSSFHVRCSQCFLFFVINLLLLAANVSIIVIFSRNLGVARDADNIRLQSSHQAFLPLNCHLLPSKLNASQQLYSQIHLPLPLPLTRTLPQAQSLEQIHLVPPRGILWFLHIHKAGGSNFCILKGENGVELGAHDNCVPSSGNIPVTIADLSPQQQKDFALAENRQMITAESLGNENFSWEPPGGLFTYVIAIRDPLDRWLSHCAHKARWQGVIAEDEVNTPPLNFTTDYCFPNIETNMMTRFLSQNLHDQVTDADLDKAKEILRDYFTLILPAEFTFEARLLLMYVLKWKRLSASSYALLESRGSNQYFVRRSRARIELPKNELAKLVVSEAADLKLYEYGVSLFEEHMHLVLQYAVHNRQKLIKAST